MSELNPVSVFLVAMLMGAIIVAVAARRLARAQRRASQRIIEKPNSHYTSQLARNNESRDRWHDMALDRLHELNRAEVLRLLEKVDASGVDVLRTNERVFLDRMAELAGTPPPPSPRDKGTPPAPGLRHSPA